MPVTFKFCLMIHLLVLFRQTVPAQGKPWPVHYLNRLKDAAPVTEGFIVLTDGDTLRGFIKLFTINSSYYPILDTRSNQIQDVGVWQIESMHIYDNSPNGPYVDYIHLPNQGILWRLDGKRKDVAIYDDVLKGGWGIRMILVTPKARIKIYSGSAYIFHHGYSDEHLLLIRFINQRYKTSVKDEDFTSTQEIIDYILDKEQGLLENPRPEKPY